MSIDQLKGNFDIINAFTGICVVQCGMYIKENLLPVNTLLFDQLKNYLSDSDKQVSYYTKIMHITLKKYYKELFNKNSTINVELLVESKIIESIDDDAFFKEFAIVYTHQLINIYVFAKQAMEDHNLSAEELNLKPFFKTIYPF